tara:strand:- start:50620 stop:51525 length:906 start_codon:yes stop_codon:yes gene_type:complete
MNLQETDLNLFKVFNVVYTEKNLTKAGEVLGITQPAVSNSLSRLREMFNDELFIRSSKGMLPTPVAQNIIGDIRNALGLINDTISQAESFTPSSSDLVFKISIGDSSEYRLLPILIKEITKSAPNISVESFLIPRKETPRELSAGNVDFCIDPPVHSDSYLRHQKIYEDDYVLITRKGHPISKKRKITMEEYLNLQHMHISNRKTGIGLVDLALHKLGVSRKISLRSQNFLVAPFVIERSDLAITTTRGFAKDRGLQAIELPFKIDPVVLHLYWHESKDTDPSNKWMRELMLKSYGLLHKD